jgi:hypothetical protein
MHLLERLQALERGVTEASTHETSIHAVVVVLFARRSLVFELCGHGLHLTRSGRPSSTQTSRPRRLVARGGRRRSLACRAWARPSAGVSRRLGEPPATGQTQSSVRGNQSPRSRSVRRRRRLAHRARAEGKHAQYKSRPTALSQTNHEDRASGARRSVVRIHWGAPSTAICKLLPLTDTNTCDCAGLPVAVASPIRSPLPRLGRPRSQGNRMPLPSRTRPVNIQNATTRAACARLVGFHVSYRARLPPSFLAGVGDLPRIF